MLVVLGFVGFVLALLISVTLHEAGHFLTARRYGAKATQFFVGFGPTLWSRQTGETEWGVKAIPAGGFVRIVGMTRLEEIDPADEDRALYNRPARQRAVVLAAGSTVHFIIAIVLVLLSALAIGKAVELPPAINLLSECVPASLDSTCDDSGAVPAPAQAAGLQAGDVVVAVDGAPVEDSLAFLLAVRDKPGQPVELTVERDGARRDLTLTPTPVTRPSLLPLTEDGQPILDDDGQRIYPPETVGAIGVGIKFRQGTERLGPVEAVGYSVTMMGDILTGIVTTFTEKLGTITQVYTDKRDPQGFIGIVGAGRISGEVLASEETFAFKMLGFFGLIAGLNFFVGVFNLLPLLPLDGGHLAVLAFEQARDRIRRLFGHRGPVRPVDLNKLMPLTYAVVVFFAGFTIWLLGADIVNPIRLNS
ncbi:MAG: site-2 protease family protein [Actinomycetota bacterium]|nr:site-2 protease family protein [Actinomycetota bacterium]